MGGALPNDTMKYIAVEQPTHLHEHATIRISLRLTEMFAECCGCSTSTSRSLDPRLSDTPISLAIGRVGKLSVGRSPRRSLDRG
jgi:hypothetical protein